MGTRAKAAHRPALIVAKRQELRGIARPKAEATSFTNQTAQTADGDAGREPIQVSATPRECTTHVRIAVCR